MSASISSAFGPVLSSGDERPSWVPSGAAAFWDFARNRHWQGGFNFERPSAKRAETLGGVFQSFADNVLARTDRGALIETARTNGIANNSMQGAATGIPGTQPAGWTMTTPGWATREIVGTGQEDGMDYLDIRWTGNSPGTIGGDRLAVSFTGTTGGPSAASGQTWRGSVWDRLVAGSPAGLTIQQVSAIEYNSGGGFLDGTFSAMELPGSDRRRVTTARALANAGTVRAGMSYQFIPQASSAIDVTVRLYWPQFELTTADAPSSPIRTISGAATREADTLTLLLPPGTHDLTVTFDDQTTQNVSGVTGDYELNPAAIARPWIRHIKATRQ